MAELETYDELAIPSGAEVVGVFVNGVPLTAGHDYEVLTDRIHLKQAVRRRTSVSGLGKILLSTRHRRLQQGRRRGRAGAQQRADVRRARAPLRRAG